MRNIPEDVELCNTAVIMAVRFFYLAVSYLSFVWIGGLAGSNAIHVRERKPRWISRYARAYVYRVRTRSSVCTAG